MKKDRGKARKIIDGKLYCSKCKLMKDLQEFYKRPDGIYYYLCYDCKNDKGKWYTKNLTPEKRVRRASVSKKRYNINRKKLISDPPSLDILIKMWISRQINRCSKRNERKTLSRDILIKLCYTGLKKFPYMSFLNIGKINRMTFASIDRIDSTKSYTDDNIQIVPMWFNSAKLNGSEKELVVYMKQYLENII